MIGKTTLVNIVGARPQFIKVKPVIEELEEKQIEHLLIHTGQHYDYTMSQVIFDDLNIPAPDYDLGIGSHIHGKQTALMLERIEEVLLETRPKIVVVYGDTNSTLAGALAAAKLHIPVAHIEAGLRSFNRKMPEEINRVLTDHVSSFLFCPTKTAVDNLKKEGIVKEVYLAGDVMYDVFLDSEKLIEKRTILSKLKLKPKEYLLLTIHRQENTDNPENLKSILTAAAKTGKNIVSPVHPRTKKAIQKMKLETFENLSFIEPVGYLDMLSLEKHAGMILTDSGGVQKEAFWCGVPCITLRNETEWIETAEDGWNILVGCNEKKIIKSVRTFSPRHKQHKHFGDGKTAKRIVGMLIKQELNG
ncbi:MAG: non-hydrolyzing UDP-N-acetylglucosamine 2-epimerase [Planctomycetota bacterium]|jgi:UDP-N-acetylglucosamine 2-epimerase (non-hydrolysing)